MESSENDNYQTFRTFGKTIFQNIRTFSKLFQTFSEIFPNFLTQKQGFLTQTLHSFFKIFKIYVHFRIISELYSELKFPNFFAKISEVRKFCFFQKNFRTSKTEHFQNSRKRKIRKFPSNAGPYGQYLKVLSFSQCSLEQ